MLLAKLYNPTHTPPPGDRSYILLCTWHEKVLLLIDELLMLSAKHTI